MPLAPNPPLDPKITRFYVPANTEILGSGNGQLSAV